jgi:hypothetical protein
MAHGSSSLGEVTVVEAQQILHKVVTKNGLLEKGETFLARSFHGNQ